MLGTLADKISTREQLLKERKVSGSGAPAHTPEVDSQSYTDIVTGIIYEWFAGTWAT